MRQYTDLIELPLPLPVLFRRHEGIPIVDFTRVRYIDKIAPAPLTKGGTE